MRTLSAVPRVSTIERFHCIPTSKYQPTGDRYSEVPLYHTSYRYGEKTD